MSHTNSTAHYELPQFLGTDKPAWLTDVNGAMSAIDTAIYSAQTKANEADAKATQNTSDITTQGGQITTLSGKVSALETAQPVDEAQIELNRQNIATNAQNIVEIDNRLGHVDISAYGSTQTGAIKNIGDKSVNKCVTTDEETIGQPSLKAYAVGEFFIGKTDRNLYKVTSAISISDVLAVGTNCIVADIANELTELNADMTKAKFITATSTTLSTNSGALGGYTGSVTISSSDVPSTTYAIIPLGCSQSTDGNRCGVLRAQFNNPVNLTWFVNGGTANTYNCQFIALYR